MTRDAVVIGGGLAGAAAALRLARAGRDVLLLERSAGPHDKVCGEFLSFEAQDECAGLGIDLRALGAVPVRAVAVEARSRRTAPLPFEALSLSRRVLDEALLAAAARAGAEIRRGVRAGGLAREGDGWRVATGAGPVRAREAVLATGKHDLRGHRRPPGRQPDLVGLKMYFALPRPLPARVGLHPFPGGYAGLQPVEGGRANLCLVVREAALARVGGWDGLLAGMRAASPALDAALADAVPLRPRPLAIAAIPYGLVERGGDGLWRLGDQAAVIPSFTGEGMSIALLSARRAAEAMAAGVSADAFQRRLAADLRGQVGRSTALSRALVAPWGQAALPLLARPVLRGLLHATRIPARARGPAARGGAAAARGSA